MFSFRMNGDIWKIVTVHSSSRFLVDRTGNVRVATTDPTTLTVYISDLLSGDFLDRVIIHELGHCALFSFDLISDIHDAVYPEYWILAEEWICNFIADYGSMIFSIIGEIQLVPSEIESFIG